MVARQTHPSTNGHGPKTAILYARVSTDEQARSGYSLAQQLEALRDYCEREGYEVLEEVSDPGQSGASLERSGMDRIRDLVAAGSVSVVLAQDRDRLVREPAYLYLLREEFSEYGTKLRALNDRGDESPEGQLTDGILDQLARYERAKTTERTRRGKQCRAREGKLVLTVTPHYGFSYNHDRTNYVVNLEQMETVKRIFYLVGIEGRAQREVKRVLENEGIPTAKGKRYWSQTYIRRLIKDDAYKSHTPEEIEDLVTQGHMSAEVAARLNRDKHYGIWWFNQRRCTFEQVAVDGPEGRTYRRKGRWVWNPKEQWIAVPVPDAGILASGWTPPESASRRKYGRRRGQRTGFGSSLVGCAAAVTVVT